MKNQPGKKTSNLAALAASMIPILAAETGAFAEKSMTRELQFIYRPASFGRHSMSFDRFDSQLLAIAKLVSRPTDRAETVL